MLLKKIFWFWWRKKKKSDSEFLSYNPMLNSGKKIRTLRDKKNKYSNSGAVRKKFLNKTKKHNPLSKLNGRSLNRWQTTNNGRQVMPKAHIAFGKMS